MSEWIEYNGSDEQVSFLNKAKSDIFFRTIYGNLIYDHELYVHFSDCTHLTHYLICEPHPYADLIKLWADTGCPVWVRHEKYNPLTGGVTYPSYCMSITDWNIPGAEYSLTPFED